MERDIVNLEAQIEQNLETETELVKSLEEIDKIMESLENDSEMVSVARKIKDKDQEKYMETQAQLEKCYREGQEIFQQIQEYSQILISEKKDLEMLETLGEDVGPAYNILEGKWEQINAYTDRLNTVMGKLEMTDDSYIVKDMAANIGKQINKDASVLNKLSYDELLAVRRIIGNGSGDNDWTNKKTKNKF